jgi:hypothetical protein
MWVLASEYLRVKHAGQFDIVNVFRSPHHLVERVSLSHWFTND